MIEISVSFLYIMIVAALNVLDESLHVC